MSPKAIRRTYPDLATYLEDSGDTQAQVARAVGAQQAHISRIAAGELVPRPALAARIAKYARIPLDSFTRVYLAKRAQMTNGGAHA
jgi:transcriptional regulator with XRE-family HTH domain